MIGSHLHHRNLSPLRNAQQGKRHSDVIVQVAGSSRHAVFCREHGTQKLFRGGLAVGPGQADNRYAETGTVHPGQSLQSLQSVVHNYEPAAVGKPAVPGHHHIRRALVQGRLSETVAVKIVSAQSEEHRSALYPAAVGRDPAAGDKRIVQPVFQFSVHTQDYFLPVEPKPPSPLSLASNTSTSSHSTLS